MYDAALLWDWFALAIRWFHVATAFIWIGSVLYFLALDLGLKSAVAGPMDGDAWQIHGGGFYHIQKYKLAPEEMPEHLVWFRWESYATWASGMVLLVVLYWVGAELYLIDADVADLATWQAIALSAGSLIAGWVIYDKLCKSTSGQRSNTLILLLFVLLVIVSWGYAQVFTGRAALLHLGAFAATIMTANVAHIIIPNQRNVVAALKAGRAPDPECGQMAHQRSVHNAYLALPVIFLMLSTHSPLVFATEYSWVIGVLIVLLGVTIRHYFNIRLLEARGSNWAILAATLLALSIAGLSLVGPQKAKAQQALGPRTAQFASAAQFGEVHQIMLGRCSICHARDPAWEGMRRAPKALRLETEGDVARAARAIYLHSGVSHAMPPGNVTQMEPRERGVIRSWYQAAR